ncbi:hypothetical protein FOZ60_004689 [Perkinsus olseni]|uniref:Uncharacterized protein n=1 Tax=Perkinsus olseni TaxID=32597 RepID=A0A7J6NST8_PEROL|nr:hypothetical protein FOZ60_004689 [Perkinsus olseni]
MSAEDDDDGDKPQQQQEENENPSQTANRTDDSDAALDEKQIEETHVGGGEASQEAATDVEGEAAGDHSAPVVPSIKSSPLTSARDKPDSATGIGRSNENRSIAANGSSRTGSPPNSYRGALVPADRENGDDPRDNADIAAVVREAIDNYQSILAECPSDTRTAGHTRAVLNTLHRAAGELGMRPESNMYMDQSSSALVLASMLPLAGVPPTVDELKYNRAIADTFHFYALKNVYIPHNTVEGTFEVIEAAKHQLPFAGVWKMSKDLALVPHLVNREEVLECFRHACKGARCLAEQQFRTFLCNVARIGLSRPPHNVPIEDTMKELCRRYLVDGPQRMRRFGANVAPLRHQQGRLLGKGERGVHLLVVFGTARLTPLHYRQAKNQSWLMLEGYACSNRRRVAIDPDWLMVAGPSIC